MIDWPVTSSLSDTGGSTPPVVFVGMEEGLADEAGLQNDLLLRSTFTPVMDSENALEGIVGGASLFLTPRADSPRGASWRI